MHSETFFEMFLEEESYKTIMNSYYVCASSSIRKKTDMENVVTVSNVICPKAFVYNKGTLLEMKEAYFRQLKEYDNTFLASIIKMAIENQYNVIFLCTKKEWKLDYLKWMSDWVYMEYGYMIYDYKKYKKGYQTIRNYNREKVLKKVRAVVKKGEKEALFHAARNPNGRKLAKDEIKTWSKQKMRKFLLKKYTYYPKASRKEMMEDILDYLQS